MLHENERVIEVSTLHAVGCNSGSIVNSVRRPGSSTRTAKRRRDTWKGSKAGWHVGVAQCRDLDLWSDASD